MSETTASKSRPLKWLLGLGVLIGLYFGVMQVLRTHVSGLIQESAGKPMPDFQLKDRSGRVWTPADFRGTTTILNFFRSRCPNCVKERATIKQLASEAKPGTLQVVGVMTDRVVSGIDEGLTERTLQRAGFTHPILMATKEFMDAFHGAGWAHVTPVTYIVDTKGQITQAFRNHQSLESLRAAAK